MEGITQLAKEKLAFLQSEHQFIVEKEDDGPEYFRLELVSPTLKIEMENYRGEIYAYMSRVNVEHSRVHLYNLLEYLHRKHRSILLEYLHRKDRKKPMFHFFRNVGDPLERYTLQLEMITKYLKEDFAMIESFFGKEIEDNMARLTSYLRRQYPGMFK